MAHRPMKQAVIAPSMLALLYPLDEEIPGYPQEQFEADLVAECEKDIRQAFAAGAARVSVDFTEGRLATRDDHRNPWTGRNMLRLLPDPAGQRAGQGPDLPDDRGEPARRRERRHPDGLRRRDQPAQPRVESPEEVRDALVRAANFIPKERLGSTDDCGFSPFSIDEKPNPGSPDFARQTAWQKIANRVEGTRQAADKIGIG
jgi:hypothetical protein